MARQASAEAHETRAFVEVHERRASRWAEDHINGLVAFNKDPGLRDEYAKKMEVIKDLPPGSRKYLIPALSAFRVETRDERKKVAATTLLGWLTGA